jgi:hypothetical protein
MIEMRPNHVEIHFFSICIHNFGITLLFKKISTKKKLGFVDQIRISSLAHDLTHLFVTKRGAIALIRVRIPFKLNHCCKNSILAKFCVTRRGELHHSRGECSS